MSDMAGECVWCDCEDGQPCNYEELLKEDRVPKPPFGDCRQPELHTPNVEFVVTTVHADIMGGYTTIDGERIKLSEWNQWHCPGCGLAKIWERK